MKTLSEEKITHVHTLVPTVTSLGGIQAQAGEGKSECLGDESFISRLNLAFYSLEIFCPVIYPGPGKNNSTEVCLKG